MKIQFAPKTVISTILILVMVTFLGTSCTRISEGQIETAKLMANNLFAGITQEDYAVFSRDFDAKMLDDMDETAFQELTLTLSEELGTDYEIEWVSSQATKVGGNPFGVHRFTITSSLASEPVDFTLYTSEDESRTYISGFEIGSGEMT